jgi:hypothetical protein
MKDWRGGREGKSRVFSTLEVFNDLHHPPKNFKFPSSVIMPTTSLDKEIAEIPGFGAVPKIDL